MKSDPDKTIPELMEEVRIRDLRFHNLVIILLIILLSISSFTAFYMYRQVQQASKGAIEAAGIIKGLEDNTNKDVQDLQHHVDCIINLFGIQNRVQYYITDPKTCHLSQIPANSSSPGGATGSMKSVALNETPPTPTKGGTIIDNRGSSAPADAGTQPAPSPQPQTKTAQTAPPIPKYPLICRLTLKLLGC